MSARILAIADVYDVLTSQRPYKAPLSKDAARERLIQGSGASFDPDILHAFLHLLDITPHFLIPQRVCGLPHGELELPTRIERTFPVHQ